MYLIVHQLTHPLKFFVYTNISETSLHQQLCCVRAGCQVLVVCLLSVFAYCSYCVLIHHDAQTKWQLLGLLNFALQCYHSAVFMCSCNMEKKPNQKTKECFWYHDSFRLINLPFPCVSYSKVFIKPNLPKITLFSFFNFALLYLFKNY